MPYFALAIILSFLYLQTIAPGFTWSHTSADGGDLIGAVLTGGVPHPGGYPLYLLLSHPFQYLPFASPAFRFNFFSLVCSIAAALILFTYLSRHVTKPIAFFSTLIYATLPAIWSQALVTEVYALHLLMISTCLLFWDSDEEPRLFFPLGILLGLSASNHLTSFLLLPLFVYKGLGSFQAFEKKTFFSNTARVFGGILLGLIPYLILPLRAASNPPINWGNASTFNGFYWLVSGSPYQSYATGLAWEDILNRFRALAGFFIEQFTVLGVLLVLYGLFLRKPRKVIIPTVWIAFAFAIFAILFGSFDSYMHLLAVWLCFSIWLAFALQDLFTAFPPRQLIQIFVAAILVFLLAFRIQTVYKQVDISQDSTAEQYIAKAAQIIPQDAIIFASGDAPLFSLWYLQFALDQRLDIVIISDGLLQFDWYVESLRESYPLIEIPEREGLQPFDLIVANQGRRICYAKPENDLTCP